MKQFCILWMISTVLFLTIPLSGQNKEKIHIAVLDFSNTGGLSKFETVTLSTRLSSMLVKTEAFVVLERGKMDEILNEQGFQQSGCTTTECAVEVGKLLNVQKMVSGSIGKIGKTYTIDISLIDVRTAQIERSFIRDYKGEIDGLLQIMQEIADQISGIAGESETKAVEPKMYRLSVKSDPDGAEIRVNGRVIGQTPFESSVKAGVELEIRLHKENYNDIVRTVVVNDNVNINADLEFTEDYKQELLSRGKKSEELKSGEGGEDGGGSTWWWIGGGAVAIGAAAVILSSSHADETTPVTSDAGFPEPPARPN